MKCKFNKDKAKSALKKAGLAVRGLEHFIMASDKYFKSLSKKEADSVQKDLLRFISSTKARSSFSMRGGEGEGPEATVSGNAAVVTPTGNAAVGTPPGATSEEANEEDAPVTPTGSTAEMEQSEIQQEETVSGNAALPTSVGTPTSGETVLGQVDAAEAAIQEAEAAEATKAAKAAEAEAEGNAALPTSVVNKEKAPAEEQEFDEEGKPIVKGGGSAFGLQPNSRTGILYSALWLATLCLSGGPSCTFSPGMLEVMPCCSKWSVLVKPLVDNANELYRLNLIGLAKTTPNAKVYLRANVIFGSTIQSFYGMSMNRTIKRSVLSRRKKSNYRKTKRVRKNKTRKRK